MLWNRLYFSCINMAINSPNPPFPSHIAIKAEARYEVRLEHLTKLRRHAGDLRLRNFYKVISV